MQLSEILNIFLGGTTLVSSIVAWNSRKAQVLITDSTATQEMQKAYREFVADQRQEVADLKLEVQSLRSELNDYKIKCHACSHNR